MGRVLRTVSRRAPHSVPVAVHTSSPGKTASPFLAEKR